jgi:hypothetical protein
MPECCYRIAMDHNLMRGGVFPASVQVPQATILLGVCKLDKILLGYDQCLHSGPLMHTSGASHLVSELYWGICWRPLSLTRLKADQNRTSILPKDVVQYACMEGGPHGYRYCDRPCRWANAVRTQSQS